MAAYTGISEKGTEYTYFKANDTYLSHFSTGATTGAVIVAREILSNDLFITTSSKYYISDTIVDAEKRNTDYHPKDANLCWMGESSNLLEWSGWGNVLSGNITNEDDIYDYLRNVEEIGNYLSYGGNPYTGIQTFLTDFYNGGLTKPTSPSAPADVEKVMWSLFFNTNNPAAMQAVVTTLKGLKAAGAEWDDVKGYWTYPDSMENSMKSSWEALTTDDFDSILGFYQDWSVYEAASAAAKKAVDYKSANFSVTTLDTWLRAGRAVGLTLSFTQQGPDGNGGNGHAITIWGYEYDERFSPDDPHYITGIYVTDSDDNMDQVNGRTSPDKLKLLQIEWSDEEGTYYLGEYGSFAYGMSLQSIAARPDSFAEQAMNNVDTIKYGETSINKTVGLYGDNTTQVVYSGGRSVNDTVGISGTQFVHGAASHTIISGTSAIQIISSGGSAVDAQVKLGGQQVISNGGIAQRSILSRGGLQIIYAGGSAVSATIREGAEQDVYGVADRTTILAGGVQQVVSGGRDDSAIIWGTQTVEKNANASNGTIMAGGVQTVFGQTSRTTVSSGGLQNVYGKTSSSIILTGGYQNIYDKGIGLRTQVSSGGLVNVSSGGVASANVITSDGTLVVHEGGVAQKNYVRSWGLQVIGSGGKAVGTIVDSYGYEFLQSGGVASDTVIDAYGFQTLASGGSAHGTTVGAFGTQMVASGASATQTRVTESGTLILQQNGYASGVEMEAHANLNVTFGGNDSTYLSGSYDGDAFQIANGAAENIVLNNGGQMNLLAGATATNTTVHSGGMLTMAAGATLSGDLKLGGRLEVNGTVDVANLTLLVSERKSTDLAMVADLNSISFSGTITIDAKTDMASGTYQLASGASRVETQDFTLIADGVAETFTVGQTLQTNKGFYTLNLSGGNLSITVSAIVTWYDSPGVTADITSPTSSNVKLTVEYDDDVVSKLYSSDGGASWKEFDGVLNVAANGSFLFRGVDADGNSTQITQKDVTNIDASALKQPTLSLDTTAPTTDSVMVTITFDGSATAKQYSFDGITWYNYSSAIKMSRNGSIFARAQRGAETLVNRTEVTNIVASDKIIVMETAEVAPSSGITARERQGFSYLNSLESRPTNFDNIDLYILAPTDDLELGGTMQYSVSYTGGTNFLFQMSANALVTIGGSYSNHSNLKISDYSEGSTVTTINYTGNGYLAMSSQTGGVNTTASSIGGAWLQSEGETATGVQATGTLTVLGNLSGKIEALGLSELKFVEDMYKFGYANDDYNKLVAWSLPDNMGTIKGKATATGIAANALTLQNDFEGEIKASATLHKDVELLLNSEWYVSRTQMAFTGIRVTAKGLDVEGEIRATAGDFAGTIEAEVSDVYIRGKAMDNSGAYTGIDKSNAGNSDGLSIKGDDLTVYTVSLSDMELTAKAIEAGSMTVRHLGGALSAKLENNIVTLDANHMPNFSTSTISGVKMTAIALDSDALTITDLFDSKLSARISSHTFKVGGGGGLEAEPGSVVADPTDTVNGYSLELFLKGMKVAGTLTVNGAFNGEISLVLEDMTYYHLSGNPTLYANGIQAGSIAAQNVRLNTKINFFADSQAFTANRNEGAHTGSFYGISASSITAEAFTGSITVDVGVNNQRLWTEGFTADKLTNGNDEIFDFAGSINMGNSLDSIAVSVKGDAKVRVSGELFSLDTALFFGTHGAATSTLSVIDQHDNYLEFAAGSKVTGKIEMGGGADTVVFDSNSRVNTSLTSLQGSLDLYFVLNNQAMAGVTAADGAILTVNNNLLASTMSITVNINDAEVGKDYILIQDLSGITAQGNGYRWTGYTIGVQYQGTTYQLKIGETLSNATCTISTKVVDNRVILNVNKLTDSFAAATPTLESVTKVTAQGAVELAWTAGGDAKYVELEYRVNGGKSIVVKMNASQTTYQLKGLQAGDAVEYRVREIYSNLSAGGSFGDWSKTQSFLVGKANAVVSGPKEFYAESQSGAVALLDWSDAACTAGLKYYEVRYSQGENEPNWTAGTYNTKLVTSSELLISGLVNGVSLYAEVRTVDKYGNKSDWIAATAKPSGGGDDDDEPGNGSVVFTPKAAAISATVSTKTVTDTVTGAITKETSIDAVSVTLSSDVTLTGDYATATLQYCFQVCDNQFFSGDKLYSMTVSNTSCTINNTSEIVAGYLAAMGTVYWRVTAVTDSGRILEEFWTPGETFTMVDPVTGTKLTDTVAPTLTGAVTAAFDRTKNTLSVDWADGSDVFGVSHYEVVIYKDGKALETVKVKASELVYNVKLDGNYTVKVRAMDGAGKGSSYIQTTDKTFIDITAPVFASSSVSVATSERDAQISWSKATDNDKIAGYEIEYITKGASWTTARKITAGSSDTSTWLANLVSGSYQFRVRALDASDNASAWSDVGDFTINASLDASNTMNAATPLDWGVENSQSVGGSDSNDYFRVEMTGAGEVTISLSNVVNLGGATTGITLTVYDVNGKSVETKTIKSGMLDDTMLLDLVGGSGVYYIRLNAKTNTNIVSYTVEANVNYFPTATDDNTPADADKNPLDGSGLSDSKTVSGWVGYGDAFDYHEFQTDRAGQVTITIGDLTAYAKVLLYDGNGKKLKTYTVKKDGTIVTDYLLNGNYTIAVQSYDSGKGKYNTNYTLTVDETYFPAATVNDNDFKSGLYEDILLTATGEGTATGWVGYGDKSDAYRINGGIGMLDLTISDVTATIKVNVYDENFKKLKSVTVKATGNGQILNNLLLPTGAAYLEVVSGDSGKGKQNSSYELTVNERIFPAATDDNTRQEANHLGAVDALGVNANGWVGYGDKIDMFAVELGNSGRLDLDLDLTETDLVVGKQIKLALYDANGKTIKLDGNYISKTELAAGTYYVGVSTTSEKKYCTEYNLAILAC